MRQTDESKWSAAIRDAKGEISSLTRQLARLRQAIRIFEVNEREKMDWPGGRESDV
jgi:hypothetical protein